MFTAKDQKQAKRPLLRNWVRQLLYLYAMGILIIFKHLSIAARFFIHTWILNP